MLKKFECINFKSFQDHLLFDLTSANYSFNNEIINEGIISTAMVYGENASGKSNLGLAIFDIINNMGNKETHEVYQNNYSCLYGESQDVYFKYTFEFRVRNKIKVLTYEYIKADFQSLLYESLSIDGEPLLEIYRKEAYDRHWSNSKYEAIRSIGENKKHHKADTMSSALKGTDSLLKIVRNPNMSIISYIKNNANLDYRDHNNQVFREFVDFIDQMLWFRSVEYNTYIGLVTGSERLDAKFAKDNCYKGLEQFLNSCGIDCILNIENNKVVQVFSEERYANFFEIASSGTKSLALLYYWSLRLKEHQGKFLFIDEFDSTFHTRLSKSIIKLLRDMDIQVILTSHNTNLISNEILRPDAYFALQKNSIKSFNKLTEKEIRQIHNLEKLYLANTFINV